MNFKQRKYFRLIANLTPSLISSLVRTVGIPAFFLLLFYGGAAQGLKASENTGLPVLANAPSQVSVDSLRFLLEQAIQNDDLKTQAACRLKLADVNKDGMLYDQVIEESLKALHIYEGITDTTGIVESRLALQGNYREAKDYRSSLTNAFLGLTLAKKNKTRGNIFFPGHELEPLLLAEISQTYLQMQWIDSALMYCRKAVDWNVQMAGSTWNFPLYLMGTIQTIQGNSGPALENFKKAWLLSIANEFPYDTIQIASGISTLFKKMGRLDSSVFYAMMVIKDTNSRSEPKNYLEALSNLVEIYKKESKNDSALKYFEQSSNFKDRLFSDEKLRTVSELTSKELDRQREVVVARQQYRNNLRTIILFGGLVGLLITAALLWRNNLSRKKSYFQLEEQKKETDEQKVKAETTLEELKSTQKQLIQSEKMASLGELTAGIAHEIQNPLNFVNNFAEINVELLKELEHAIGEDNQEEVGMLMGDININLSKITHHGKRADNIVKGMLQHSRSDKGQKEFADINKLADEYLRLAYHGMRSKDKSFNAALKTDYDVTLTPVHVNGQDFGRVLLNLFNNAFYEVMHKRYTNGEQPMVFVGTKKRNDGAEIRIRDNGMGIPEKIIDKIFQPFFTTKPSGQGTGLGLSLSYDIIVKEHDGNITVNTKDGQFTEFSIWLPTGKT